jgi:hypothetical protein
MLKIVKETENPSHGLYSSVKARKIKDATELINDVVEKLRAE